MFKRAFGPRVSTHLLTVPTPATNSFSVRTTKEVWLWSCDSPIRSRRCWPSRSNSMPDWRATGLETRLLIWGVSAYQYLPAAGRFRRHRRTARGQQVRSDDRSQRSDAADIGEEDAGLPGECQHSSSRTSRREFRSNNHPADQNRSRPDQG